LHGKKGKKWEIPEKNNKIKIDKTRLQQEKKKKKGNQR